MIEITITFAIILYIALYGLDLSTALEFRRVNKKEFEKVEANSVFVRNLNHYGIFKGILVTILVVELQYMIMIALGLFGALSIVLGSVGWVNFVMVFLVFNSIFHGLGALTNMISCVKYTEKNPFEEIKEDEDKKSDDDKFKELLYSLSKEKLVRLSFYLEEKLKEAENKKE